MNLDGRRDALGKLRHLRNLFLDIHVYIYIYIYIYAYVYIYIYTYTHPFHTIMYVHTKSKRSVISMYNDIIL